MKRFLATITVLIVVQFTAMAQSDLSIQTVKDLKAVTKDGYIVLSWKGSQANGAGDFWQVQGSVDGKEYAELGYVWGTQPGKEEIGLFQTKLSGRISKMKYYRVITVAGGTTGYASHVIRL